jgi:hypothetical protein
MFHSLFVVPNSGTEQKAVEKVQEEEENSDYEYDLADHPTNNPYLGDGEDDENEYEMVTKKRKRAPRRGGVLSKENKDRVVFTVSSLELYHGQPKPKRRRKAKKKGAVKEKKPEPPRKTKATPTISFSVWPTGRVGLQGGRSREHVILATRMAAEFLSHFTMHDSNTS